MNKQTNNKILEREREREKRNSFLKKSFSLVEAAIYLMLVGVLTMAIIGGAALIEKARVRSVIEDIDFYVKSYREFTMAFNAIPGSITLKQCQDNIKIFKLCKKTANNDTEVYTGDTVMRITPGYLSVGRNNEEKSEFFNIIMRQWDMFTPLLGVEKKLDQTLSSLPSHSKNHKYGCGAQAYKCLSYSIFKQASGKIHYDMKNSAVTLEGFLGQTKRVYYARSSNGLTKNRTANFGVETSFSNVNIPGMFNRGGNSNIPWVGLLISYNTPAKLDSNYGGGTGSIAIFGAQFLRKVDKKMDTGFPRRGKLLALKTNNGYNTWDNWSACYRAGTKDDERKKKTPTEYVKNNKRKYGCNVLYVMPDVSEFIFG